MTKVAVIVPNYNHARYLTQRIDSVLAQTYRDFKLLILDDLSPDDSREVIERYRSDSRVSVEYNAVNSGGTYFQWKKGIVATSSDYVWIAESDDYADPGFLERLVQELDERPNVAMAVCESILVDESNNRLGSYSDIFRQDPAFRTFTYPPIESDFSLSGREYCRKYMFPWNTIPNASAVLFRRSAFHEIDGPDTGMRICGDWFTYCKILMRFDISRVADPLNFFRTHKNNVRNSTKIGTFLLEQRRVREYLRAQLGVREDYRNRMAALMLETQMLIGQERQNPNGRVPVERILPTLVGASRFGPGLFTSTLAVLAKEKTGAIVRRFGLRRRNC
jgi:glycosyltransferase involved in cell wall biosynthesis